jgi:hypothetical protein
MNKFRLLQWLSKEGKAGSFLLRRQTVLPGRG